MYNKRLVKNDKGSVAIYAIATVLSFILILSAIFFVSTVIRKNQLRTLYKIKEIYAKEIAVQEVAIAKNIKYQSLQSAIDNIEENSEVEITLLQNITECVTIPQNKNIVLDLNGNNIKNGTSQESIITVNGTLKLENGEIDGEYVENVPAILVNQNGALSVDRVTIENEVTESNGEIDYIGTIQTYGNLNIKSGEIRAIEGSAVRNEETGTAIITGGTVIATEDEMAICNLSSGDNETAGLVIKGGTISSIINGKYKPESGEHDVIYDEATVEISGTDTKIGNESTSICALENYAIATINEGSIKQNLFNAIKNSETGILTINGGTIYSNKPEGNTINNYGETTITGGKIVSGNFRAIRNYTGGKLNVSGGIIIGYEANYAIYNSSDNPEKISKIVITGGIVKGILNGYTGYTAVELTISGIDTRIENEYNIYATIHNYGKATISDGAAILANTRGIYNRETGVLEISGTDTKIQSYSSSMYTIINNGVTTINNGTITSDNFRAIYNASSATLIVRGGTISGKNYSIYNVSGGSVTISGGTITGTKYNC